MQKSEVYTWRVSPETKSRLEEEARRAHASVGELLERIVESWLASLPAEDAQQQRSLHAAAARCIGSIGGKDPKRSERVSELVRKSLDRRRAR